MDADTRPNSAVMAYVGPRGATYAELRKALGWAHARLDSVLGDLRRSRVLVLYLGRYFRPECFSPSLLTHEPSRSKRQRGVKLKQRMQAAHERYELCLAMRREGADWVDIAERFSLSKSGAQRLMDRARLWDRAGRPSGPMPRRRRAGGGE